MNFNPEEMQDHLSKLLDGKIGKLAKEIAEETTNDLNNDENSMQFRYEKFIQKSY